MPARLRRLAPRITRLALFVMAVSLVLQFALGRLLAAETDSSLLALGGNLAQLDAAGGSHGERIVELNGTRVRLTVEGRHESLGAVLDGAEAGCAPAGGRALRGSEGGRGYVVCSLPGAPAGPVIGEVRQTTPSYRYVYGQTGDEGTLTVSVVVDGSIDLTSLFPPTGDAPGADPQGLPRPPDARRLLSARELGTTQEIAMYLAEDGDPADLADWYRAKLPALGWRPLDTPRADGRPRVLLAERAGTLVALVFADDAASGGASVVILTSLEEEGK
jgi:hypothetical protein